MNAERETRTDGPPGQAGAAQGEGGPDTQPTQDGADSGASRVDLERELASTKDRLMRALAEQENARRRAQRERDETVRYGNADLARDLLPIIDNLTRALDSLPEEDVADESMLQLLRGVAAIERQMLQTLERYGVRRFDPSGEPFDPHSHQAVFQSPAGDRPEGTVTEVLQPGYRHHDRLLRPAMVGVAGAGQGNPLPQDEHGSHASQEKQH